MDGPLTFVSLATHPRRRVLVAMSGGVDSSVAALLVRDQGVSVVGATLDLGPHGADERKAAQRVASELGIKHIVIDARRRFVDDVVAPFAAAYAAGITPNPCVECNRAIKWGLLLEAAQAEGCDGLATGHYSHVAYDARRQRYCLVHTDHAAKDQTYFLYAVSQEALAYAVFPLASLTKATTRQRAVSAGLSTATKRDSQDVCFIDKNGLGAWLDATLGTKRGPIVDETGVMVGQHNGLWHATVGQRRGLGLGGLPSPRYVTAIATETNTIVVGPEASLWTRRATVANLHWMRLAGLDTALRCWVKVRAAHRAQMATVVPTGTSVSVTFDEPVRALTPGQAAVFYGDDGSLLGGGQLV